jgi:hypothetical protein
MSPLVAMVSMAVAAASLFAIVASIKSIKKNKRLLALLIVPVGFLAMAVASFLRNDMASYNFAGIVAIIALLLSYLTKPRDGGEQK